MDLNPHTLTPSLNPFTHSHLNAQPNVFHNMHFFPPHTHTTQQLSSQSPPLFLHLLWVLSLSSLLLGVGVALHWSRERWRRHPLVSQLTQLQQPWRYKPEPLQLSKDRSTCTQAVILHAQNQLITGCYALQACGTLSEPGV